MATTGVELGVDPGVIGPLQHLVARATHWKDAVEREVSRPEPAVFNMELIKRLRDEKETIPVKTAQDRCLAEMVEDGGSRYCICKGPADGSFMVGCDHCEGWFHGRCVGVTAHEGARMATTEAKYACPDCAAAMGAPYVYAALMGGENFPAESTLGEEEDDDDDDDDDDAEDEVSAKTAWLGTLWPPVRLLHGDAPGTRGNATMKRLRDEADDVLPASLEPGAGLKRRVSSSPANRK